MSAFTLADLERIVAERAVSADPASYTAKLFAKGPSFAAKKFGEEAVEAVIAAVEGDEPHLTAEAADVLYHLLVMMRLRGVTLDEVMMELARRTSQTGLQEKASRPKD
jgi:phosphoribosyl-ATP pyrophosphohydrolase